MKKGLVIGATLIMGLSLAACGSNASSNKSEKAADKTMAVKKDSTSIPKDASHEWFFKNNVFYAGNETMTLTKSEIRDGAESGTKVLVVYCTILNNSKKEQDPSNFYMVVHAKQKTDTSNVQLGPGTVALDENSNNPLQAEEDNLNNSLLPAKKINTALMFTLKNTNKVTLEFSNADYDTIGKKTYEVQ